MSNSPGEGGATGRRAWTPGRSVVLLLLILDITVVAGWLFVYSDEYDRVAKVVGGVWGAVMVFLGAVGWKSKEGTSLPALMGLLPTRLLAAAYTLLILGALPFWVAYHFPVHRVAVAGSGVPASARWRVVVTRGGDTVHVHEGGASWTFRARPGTHTLEASVDGYLPFPESFPVRWLALSDHIDLAGLEAVAGVLRLSFDRDMTWEIFDSVGGGPVRSGAATAPGPLEVALTPGRYLVRARAPDARPDSATITLTPGDTADAEVRLRRAETLGTLTVRSDPEGAELFVDGERVGATPWSGRRAPGSHAVIVRRRSPSDPRFAQFFRGSVEVRATGETVFEPALESIPLPALRILAGAAGGATYYLDRADADHALGRVEGSAVFYVFPGTYLIVSRAGAEVTECGTVTLRPGDEEVVRC